MLLTSHLDNLHNVTDLKMHGEEDPFPFFCGSSLWDLYSSVAVGSVVAPPGAIRDSEGGRTGMERGSLTDTSNITTGKQLQFPVPVPYQQNK